jgi:hypothetical protein
MLRGHALFEGEHGIGQARCPESPEAAKAPSDRFAINSITAFSDR